jgi:flagellar biosynthetic protein FliR
MLEGFGQGFLYYLLIFARIAGLVFTAPILGAEAVAFRVKIVLSLMLAAVLYPVNVNYMGDLPSHVASYAMLIFSQTMIGIIIGFMITIVFTSFQIAGEIFSVQMGISFSEILDPQSQISVPILGTLKNLIGVLVFLGVDFYMDGFTAPAYLHMIRALAYSFQLVPGFGIENVIAGGTVNYLDEVFGVMFVTALKIGIPVMGIVFISSVALGLLGRAAPQMNLMNMGVQINIIVGLFVLLIIIPVLLPLMRDAFVIAFDKLGDMFRHWPVVKGVN